MQLRIASTVLTLLVLSASAFGASGCSDDSDSSDANSKVFTQENIAEIFALQESDMKGAKVEDVVGQVSQVQRDGESVSIAFYSDPENVEGQLIVDAPSMNVKEEDYVQVSGRVSELFEGENALGAELQVPRIEGSSVKVVPASAMDPPEKTIAVNQTKDLAGVRITVVKAELSGKTTRIWVRYKNTSNEDFTDTPSLTSDGEQVEESYTDDYKSPASMLSSGAKTSGALVYEPVALDSRMTLTYTGFDADYNEVKVKFKFGG